MTFSYFFFFFSSRRRHTRSLRDWSSDVCSSDLHHHAEGQHHQSEVFGRADAQRDVGQRRREEREAYQPERAGHERRDRSEERREGKSVDVGGRRSMRKKKKRTRERRRVR